MPRAPALNKLIRQLQGFDRHLNKVNFIMSDKGNCLASLKLEEEHLNPMGVLHGGCSASLVDIISSAGLLTHDSWSDYSLSVNIQLAYFRAAKLGEEITINSKLIHSGKNMAIMDTELRNADNKLIVKAGHTKLKMPS